MDRYVGDRFSNREFRQSHIRVHHRLQLEAVVVECVRGKDWDELLQVARRGIQDGQNEESRVVKVYKTEDRLLLLSYKVPDFVQLVFETV